MKAGKKEKRENYYIREDTPVTPPGALHSLAKGDIEKEKRFLTMEWYRRKPYELVGGRWPPGASWRG